MADMAVMRSGYLVVILLLGASAISFGQIVITGVVLNEEDKSPIAYANIGILDTSVGTISNPDGTFEIHIPVQHRNDSLLFSALGFGKRSFKVSELVSQKALTIHMQEQTTLLKNIVVKSKKKKPARTFQFGNNVHDAGSIHVDSIAAGSAMALLIENKYPAFQADLTVPYFARKARLRISYNTFDEFKIRLRFLSVHPETGLPHKDLYNGSIVIKSELRRGWVTFDLSKYNIRIDDQAFYLVFEWLIDDDDRRLLMEMYREFERQFPKKVTTDTVMVEGEKITFSSYHGYRAGTSFASSSQRDVIDQFKCYYRNNSHGQWRRSSSVIAANVVVVNY
ncbi:MAG TPA: carboxypeptidase-like regulatory domain-containing protein [Ohtaekwangia sp.]|nr:carboxypeptidase-like regulatory domain-containing protein [Ohtaekwangia sp.]